MKTGLAIIGCWSLILGLLFIPACLSNPLAKVGDNTNIPETTTEFTPTQYHIQTDEGDSRFFKYQTWSGQFRKENRLDDGSVVGSYGWVDANGILRLYDYVADNKGYRIVKTRLIDVGKQGLDGEPVTTSSNFKKSDQPLDNSIEDSQFTRRQGLVEVPQRPYVPQPIVADLGAPVSARLQRKIFTQGGSSVTIDVQPIFDLDPSSEQQTFQSETFRSTPSAEIEESTAPFVARGEGYRTSYSPNLVFNEVTTGQRGPHLVAKSRSEDGRRVVVKRRRPNSQRRNEESDLDKTLDYNTGKSFHREEVSDDGSRIGQFGYIDPIGVRRVVNYATGPKGEIIKSKENDYVGTDTYFVAS